MENIKFRKPKDYSPVIVYINGCKKVANLVEDSVEFMKHIDAFGLPDLSDDECYYVVRERQPKGIEIYWCYESALETPVSNRISYEHDLDEFNEFIYSYGLYIMEDPKADLDNFNFYKAIQSWVKTPADEDIRDDNKACVVSFLREHWKAWYESVLNREYKYMNVSGLVHDCWECL